MKKSVKLLSAVLVLTLCLPAAAYAGQWVQDPDKKQKYGPEDKAEISNWWYREDDGSYPVSDWKEIDGKWYYFNEDGWMLRETTTPDQMKVDHNGVWVPDILKAYPAEIKYNTIPPRFSNGQSKGITFTDSKLIGDIVSGIAKLKLEPLEDGKDYSTVGMVTMLELMDSDGTVQKINYNGSVLTTEGHSYRMAEKDEAELNAVFFKSYASQLQAEGYEITPSGVVDRIIKDESGWETSFRINCTYTLEQGKDMNIIYQVKRGEAPILDAAGDYWMILHEGDQVQVVYDSNGEGELTAKAILILKHSRIE